MLQLMLFGAHTATDTADVDAAAVASTAADADSAAVDATLAHAAANVAAYNTVAVPPPDADLIFVTNIIQCRH